MTSTLSLFEDPQPIVPGLRYAADLVSLEEGMDLVERFETLPFEPFDFRGFKGNRETVAFGSRYDFTRGRVKDAPSIPDWLGPLKARAAIWAGLPDESLGQALVTRYRPGAGIGWHRDRPDYDQIIGVSFGSPCILRLRRREGDRWVRANAPLEPRSIYLLCGEVRDVWQHSITPGDTLRYSVTFRTAR